ncbi:MAG: MarR family winged helix-turn-helix transcriptional regulator [Cognatishimia sp.]|jgi:DNA-binding MarR family transcriptional regulator
MAELKEPKTEYDLRSRLGFRLSRLSKIIQDRLEKKLSKYGLSRLQWCVLSGIGLEDITTPSEIADHVGITRQAISRLLLQMRKKGWIEQEFDPKDGRSRRLVITESGRALLEACHPIVNENQTYFTNKLNAEELRMLDITLSKLVEGELTRVDSY